MVVAPDGLGRRKTDVRPPRLRVLTYCTRTRPGPEDRGTSVVTPRATTASVTRAPTTLRVAGTPNPRVKDGRRTGGTHGRGLVVGGREGNGEVGPEDLELLSKDFGVDQARLQGIYHGRVDCRVPSTASGVLGCRCTPTRDETEEGVGETGEGV